MSYTLIGSLRSPFVRMLRMFLYTQKISFHFEVINFLDSEEEQEKLKKLSPINKVPILKYNEQKIYDSRLIYEFLKRQHGLPHLSLNEENYLSAIIAMMDVKVNMLLLRRSGLDVDSSSWYVDRQNARVDDCIQFIMPWVKNLNPQRDWRYPAMALYSFLVWAEYRQLLDLSMYPEFVSFLENFKQCSGVAETHVES